MGTFAVYTLWAEQGFSKAPNPGGFSETREQTAADGTAFSSNLSPTPDWTEYKNRELGFSFQYPSEWKLAIADDGTAVHLTSPETIEWIEETRREQKVCEGCGPDVSLYYYRSFAEEWSLGNELAGKTLDELIRSDLSKKILGRTEIAGTSAIEVKEAGMDAYFVLYIQRGSRLYKIRFNHKEDRSQLSQIDRRFLASFRFDGSSDRRR